MSQKGIIAIILTIVICIVMFFLGRHSAKTTPPIIDYTEQDAKIDSLLSSVDEILHGRDSLLRTRDTLVLKATHYATTKYIYDDKEIDNTPDDMQSGITRKLQSDYNERRIKERK